MQGPFRDVRFSFHDARKTIIVKYPGMHQVRRLSRLRGIRC
ncbi:MAG: hypothetical protein JWO52_5279 [Gammaproteobacteria bacterium]|nr:hypothetical protein [Gammaproteobacteria bacterium]